HARQRSDANFLHAEFGKGMEVDAGQVGNDARRGRSLKRQRAVNRTVVGKRDIVHDDEFFQRLSKAFANHAERDAKPFVLLRVRFNFREDMTLGIQQEGYDAVSRSQILDVVRENRVEIAHAIRTRKAEIGAIAFVDKRDTVLRKEKFVANVPEIAR